MGSARICCNMLPNGRVVISRVLRASARTSSVSHGLNAALLGRSLAAVSVPFRHDFWTASGFKPFSVLASPKPTTAYMSVSSTPDKQLELGLPLPKVAGITALRFPLSATVGDLKASIASAANVPMSSIDVKDSIGDSVSSCSRLAMIVDSQWSVNIGSDFTVSAVSATFPVPLAGLGTSSPGYNALKASLMSKTGTMSYGEFVELAKASATSAGIPPSAFPSTLRTWELTLHQEGLVLHLSASEDPAIRDVVFIKPQLAHADLLQVLDLHAVRTSAKLTEAVNKLSHINVTLKTMDGFAAVARERARKRIRNISLAAGAFMIVQWGVIADLIYEESWDVMEPIVYFVSVGYGLLFYLFFFMRTKRDPNTTSIFNHFFNTSLEKAHRALANKESWRSVSKFTAEKQGLERQAEKLTSQIQSLRNSLPPQTASKA